MNVSGLRRMLKRGNAGRFRPLKEGEPIEASDICVYDCFVESPSETSIGKRCEPRETIIRFEFDEAGEHQGGR